MPVLVTDPHLEEDLIRTRELTGANRYDEVWEGVYITAPLPNDEHQDIQLNFGAALKDALGWNSPAKIRAGVNVSDRAIGWEHNFRCPDVVVYLPGNRAINHGSHWQWGPDFLVEVVSDRDRAYEKLSFYSGVGVREAMFVNRDPWSLELYCLGAASAELELIGQTDLDSPALLESKVLPLRFRLVAGAQRPHIEMIAAGTTAGATADSHRWLI